jgi:predicted component of type VI protein secretion system
MKRLLTLLLFAVIIIACKKEDYSAGEYYKVTYQTIEHTMQISITATQNINPANFKGLRPDIKFKQAQYLISLYDEQSYKIDFIKLDGSVFPLELRASEKKMTLDF